MLGFTTGRGDSHIAERETLAIAQLFAWSACALRDPESRSEANNFVYLARHGRGFKIGISERPLCRVNSLKPHGHRLVLIIFGCGTRHERVLHKRLDAERTHGEYFQGPETEHMFATLALEAVPVSQLVPSWGQRGTKPPQRSQAQRLLAELLKTETQVGFSKRAGVTQATISGILSGRSKPRRLAIALALERCGIPLGAWDEAATEGAA